MEFKYRAVDQRSRADLPLFPWTISSSQAANLGSFSKGDPASQTRSTLCSIPPYEVEKIRREIEKQQIRQDIVAAEIARRQILEAEVRMELMMEREMARQRTATQVFLSNNQFTKNCYPQIYPFDYGPLKEPSPFSHPTILSRLPASLPQHQPPLPSQTCGTPSEIRPPTGSNKDKLIVLARPDRKISCPKRKAVTDPAAVDSEVAPFGLKRKPREEWSCALCHVSASSERTFHAHVHGKKHKAKANGLRAHANPKTVLLPKEIESKDTLATIRSENLDLGADSFHLKEKPREGWSCALCQVSTNGETGYKEHIQGKKHKAKENRSIAHLNSNKNLMLEEIEISSKRNEEITSINGSETLWCGESLKPEQKEDIEVVSNKQSSSTVMSMDVKNEARRKEKLKFWCEMCRVGAHCLKVMESHERGRKHMARMKHVNPSYQSTCNVMQAATGAAANEKAD